jgi:flagellar biogenesis protein FliO
MELLQQLAAVALVLGLLGAALWLLQRKRLTPLITLAARRSGPRQLEVVERVALSPQHSLALVKVNGVMMLVGTGPGVCEIRNVEAAS